MLSQWTLPYVCGFLTEYVHVEYVHVEYVHVEYKHVEYVHVEYVYVEYVHVEYVHEGGAMPCYLYRARGMPTPAGPPFKPGMQCSIRQGITCRSRNP